MRNKNSGFTLVEVAIAIVIIGLIVTGVMVGTNLVRQAKVKSLIVDVRKYLTAYNNFQLEYHGFPGDLSNAANYWSAADNGDGNRLIGDSLMSEQENKGFFEQLGLAGLIEGSYDGSTGEIIGVDIPPSPYGSDVSYYVYSNNLWSQYASKGNSLVVCGPSDNCWDNYRVAIKDAYAIDEKIDDAMPYTGKIISFSDTDGQCVASGARLSDSAAKTTTYLLTDQTDKCTVHFAFDDYIFR
ncbi:prepilin-type N-terminal cleavage/methylation domain-containing protein [Rickettsiales bacterium]|nr:prepilin-type N-terminal cleavage/methylation domain-containing protein [Rickettsiales bacterium]